MGEAIRQGVAGETAWSDPKFAATGWKGMDLPGQWEGRCLPGFDGIAWFREEVDLPRTWGGLPTTIEPGSIDDRDTTFFNGGEIGHTETRMLRRKYAVPARVLKAGRDVIPIRALDTGAAGGFSGPKEEMRPTPGLTDGPKAGAGHSGPVSLAGAWTYAVSASIIDRPYPPRATTTPIRSRSWTTG